MNSDSLVGAMVLLAGAVVFAGALIADAVGAAGLPAGDATITGFVIGGLLLVGGLFWAVKGRLPWMPPPDNKST